jgi:hypothetical protein
MSVCRTFETYVFGENGEISTIVESPIVFAETIRAPRNAFPTPLPYDETFVKISDRVRLVTAGGRGGPTASGVPMGTDR